MEKYKSFARLFYEELRLLAKDTFEAISRIKKICTNPDTYYIMVNDHIGDMIIALGYLKAYREKKKLKDITLVITDKFKEFAEQYSDSYNNIIFLTQHDLYRTFLINGTRFGQLYLEKEYQNVLIINPADAATLRFDYLKRHPDITLEKLIRQGCYGLDDDCEFVQPSIISNERVQKHGAIALLSIEVRSVTEGDIFLFEKLVPELKKKGYAVYTNTNKEDMCIKGTLPIYPEVNDISNIIGNGILIGVRSGLHDLLLYQDCKVVAIYPENDDSRDLFSLDMMPASRAKYIQIKQSQDVDVDCKKIMDFIKG